MIKTYILKEDLENYKEVLPTITDWDKSKQPNLWLPNRIDGEMMYKIHRRSSKIVDETGLRIQGIIYDLIGDSEKIFPYYYQILKIDRVLEVPKSIDNCFLQTITFLTGEYEDNTFVIEPNNLHMYAPQKTEYAFAIGWSKEVNPNTPKWFIRPYYRMFA